MRRLVSTAPLLETLDVSGTRTGAGPTGEWLERAAASGALKELTIARSGLAGTPVARLADGLAAAGCVLATLDASDNEGIGDGGAGRIAAAETRFAAERVDLQGFALRLPHTVSSKLSLVQPVPNVEYRVLARHINRIAPPGR